MKLAIDISQIVYKGSGVARFNEGLVRAICEHDKENEWTFFCSGLRQKIDQELETLIQSKGFRLIDAGIPPTALSLMWNQLHMVSIDSWIGDVDWLITSDWTEAPSKNKKATIIHDFVYLKYPETVDKTIRSTQQKRLQWVRKESSLVFVDSEATKRDYLEYMPTSTKKVFVNYPGVRKIETVLEMKKKFRTPFILTVGKLEPRKNIDRLIKAFNQLERHDIDLRIVGMEGWGNVSIEDSDNINAMGFVPDPELAQLYEECAFFILPSLYEGFGYPVVEAMQHKAPVAVSNTSSLKEIVGNAGLLFNPESIDEMTSIMKKLLDSEEKRKKLSKLSLEQSKKFTWKNYYNNLITTLRSNN